MTPTPASLRRSATGALLYAASARRVLVRTGARDLTQRLTRHEDRLAFVVGSPRSGTTFLAGAIAGQPSFVDLTEVTPLKAAIPDLVGLPAPDAARRIRRILERVRVLALVPGVRGVEQTPETAFILAAALQAYPRGRAVHALRDGRDVVCSLLEKGWLSSGRAGGDDARGAYGARARFWVEPERLEEFEAASDATRAAWCWRRYVSAARAAAGERVLELRYEELVADREAAARRLAAHLGGDEQALLRALAPAHADSVGRWRRDLSAAQLADVEREAGALLAELNY